MQALYLLGLDPIAETLADGHSYGFRLERSCADAIGQCHLVTWQATRSKMDLEGDIKSCFDRISHDWLLAHIPMDKGILRAWLKAGFLEKASCSPPRKEHLKAGLSPRSWRTEPWMDCNDCWRNTSPATAARKGKVHLVRYADDFIITGTSEGSPASRSQASRGTILAVSGVSNSPTRRPGSRISKTASISWAKRSGVIACGKSLIKPSQRERQDVPGQDPGNHRRLQAVGRRGN